MPALRVRNVIGSDGETQVLIGEVVLGTDLIQKGLPRLDYAGVTVGTCKIMVSIALFVEIVSSQHY